MEKRSVSIDNYRNYSKEIQEMLLKTKHCLNCGKRLLRGHGKKPGAGYCRYSCYTNKPPLVAYVERDHNKPFKEILREKLNKSDNMQLVADFLGISRDTVYRYIKRFGIKRKVTWE